MQFHSFRQKAEMELGKLALRKMSRARAMVHAFPFTLIKFVFTFLFRESFWSIFSDIVIYRRDCFPSFLRASNISTISSWKLSSVSFFSSSSSSFSIDWNQLFQLAGKPGYIRNRKTANDGKARSFALSQNADSTVMTRGSSGYQMYPRISRSSNKLCGKVYFPRLRIKRSEGL